MPRPARTAVSEAARRITRLALSPTVRPEGTGPCGVRGGMHRTNCTRVPLQHPPLPPFRPARRSCGAAGRHYKNMQVSAGRPPLSEPSCGASARRSTAPPWGLRYRGGPSLIRTRPRRSAAKPPTIDPPRP
eukprot:364623-Chlamydomonas_euryale.AAC.5